MLRNNWGWLVVALLALLGLVGGLPAALLLGGLATIVLGLVRVWRRRPRPDAPSPGRRRPALITAAGGLAAVITGIALTPAAPPTLVTTTSASPAVQPSSRTAPTPAAKPSPSPPASTPRPSPRPSSWTRPSPKPTPQPKPKSRPAAGTALAALAGLPVKGRAPKTGYDRAEFGSGWESVTGCTTRERVLRRDLSRVQVLAGSGGCTVVGGRLRDPYTGELITVTSKTVDEVDVDHVVSLSDAWQRGAQQWSRARRVTFANDLLVLLATDQSVNASKGDGDAATWLPPKRSVRCTYIGRQISIKARYKLWVTAAEKQAMTRILATCPRQKTISQAAARKQKDPRADTVKPRPAPKPKPETKPKAGGLDPQFDTCREANDAGYGDYVHGRDPEYEWYDDRDNDGIVCER